MKTFRGGLIGCGFFATNHLEAWRDLPDAEIVAICDTNAERLRVMGDRYGLAKRFAGAEDMLREVDLDFIDIVTAVGSHRSLVELAARYRKPVICQKPFARSMADAEAMVQACDKAQVLLMVHENFRWQTPIRAIREVIDSGAIGKPFWGRVSFRSAFDVFKGQPYLAECERFIIEDLGIHSLDVARYLLGDVERLAANTRRVNPKIKGEDAATMLMTHEGGVTSVVDCSYATILAQEPFPETIIEIDGSEGSVRLAQAYAMTIATRKGSQTRDVSPLFLSWAGRPWHNIQESVLNIERHWIDCLASGKTPDTSGHDNLKTLRLVEAAYASAASGKVIATI